MQDFNLDDLLNDSLEDIEEEKKVEKPEKETEVVDVDPLQEAKDTLSMEDIMKETINEVKEEKKGYERPKPSEVKEPKVAKSKPVETKNEVAKKPSDMNVALAQMTIKKISELADTSNQIISDREKTIATDIVISVNKAVTMAGYNWKQLDLVNNNFFGDIKRWARLGIDASTDHLYADIRKNSKTGAIDIKIKGQYQTIRKLVTQYCTKKIFNWHEDVICRNDTFIKKFDFANGTEKVIDHTYGENREPNHLDDIVGAYVIAYARENDGSIIQLVTYIDKNRINRAYNSAQTKNVWNADTRKMVIKTAYWEMWNSSSIAPFMKFPDDLREDLGVVNDSADVDFNQDHTYKDVNVAQDKAEATIGSGDIIDL